MLSYHACEKCSARLRPSRLRNLLEFIISPLFLPYRCRECDRRQFKFRFVNMNPSVSNEPDKEKHTVTPARQRSVNGEVKASKSKPARSAMVQAASSGPMESAPVADAGEIQIHKDSSSSH